MIVNLFKEPSHNSVQESFDWMSSEGPDPSHIDFTFMVWRFKAISFRFGSTGGFGWLVNYKACSIHDCIHPASCF
jgi:hypothetical protein